MKPTVETITPATAKAMLAATKFRNRNITGSTVERYATDMRNGDWKVNGASIVVSESGDVLDGQHRLHAIIKSGATIKSVVARGADTDAFKTIDAGRPRRYSHALQAAGERHAGTLAAVVRILLLMKNYPNDIPVAGGGGGRSGRRLAPTASECDRFLSENPNIRTSVHLVESRKGLFRGLVTRSHLAALWYVVSKNDVFCTMDPFVDDLVRKPPRSETVKRFAERMWRAKTDPRAKLTPAERWKLLVRTWNYYAHGREVRKLAVPDTVPEIYIP